MTFTAKQFEIIEALERIGFVRMNVVSGDYGDAIYRDDNTKPGLPHVRVRVRSWQNSVSVEKWLDIEDIGSHVLGAAEFSRDMLDYVLMVVGNAR